MKANPTYVNYVPRRYIKFFGAVGGWRDHEEGWGLTLKLMLGCLVSPSFFFQDKKTRSLLVSPYFSRLLRN